MMRHRARTSSGLTLVEVLVVAAIIGVLIAILVPAVQSAREAARKARCVDNLRQMGLALNHYVGVMGTFPPGHGSRGFSPHVAILPYLELRTLYNAINIVSGGGDSPSVTDLTVVRTTPATFLCPSDQVPAFFEGQGYTNYTGNRGVGVQVYGYNGLFTDDPPVGVAAVSDGTSHTAAMSEWLLGPCDIRVRDPKRSVFQTDRRLIRPEEFEEFAASCHQVDIMRARTNKPHRGWNWLFGEFNYTLYNHTLVINDHSCTNGTRYQEGAWTATSAHHGGAHVVFADGHAGFVKDTTALQVWRALGSRNGREPASAGF